MNKKQFAKSEEDQAQDVYAELFSELANDLEVKILSENKVSRLSSLTQQYRDKLQERGLPSSYKSKRLEVKLQQHFGAKIQIIQQKGQSGSYVCASDITVATLFSEIKILKGDLESISFEDSNTESIAVEAGRMSYHSAKSIKGDLKEKKHAMQKLPDRDISHMMIVTPLLNHWNSHTSVHLN
jgi:hypothetical protein